MEGKHSFWLETASVALVFAGAVFLGFQNYKPPQVAPPNAHDTSFSALRAAGHLKIITQEPHAVGSEGNRRVREYLKKSMEAMGLEVEVQSSVGIWSRRGLKAAHVYNLISRIEGLNNSKAILLVAHYDAVPHSLGAGDDGAGVVAILESVRAIRAGEPLQNDLIILFTDGEEEGLLGAQAFVRHPMMANVGLVLNLEGRGSSGPVLMFETGANNGTLISELSKVVKYPATNSLTSAVYKVLPNYTDFTVFNSVPNAPPGYNFSFIHGHSRYHTPLDRFEELDLGTIQHHGAYVLPLIRHFGNRDIKDLCSEDRIFFVFPGLGLIHYSVGFASILAGLSGIWLVVLIVVLLRSKAIGFRGLTLGLLSFLLTLVVAPVLVFGIWRAVVWILPAYAQIQHGAAYNSIFFLIGFLGFGLLAMLCMKRFTARKSSDAEFALASLVIWVGLTLLTTSTLSGASFLFAWPALAGLGAITLYVRMPDSGIRMFLILASLGIAVALFSPVIRLIQVALTIQLAPVPVLLAVLLYGLVYLPLGGMMRKEKRLLPILAASVFLVFLVIGLATSGFDSRNKGLTQMIYLLDGDNNQARWVSRYSDPWTRSFLGDDPQRGNLNRLKFGGRPFFRETNRIKAKLPDIEISADRSFGRIRDLEFQIRTAPGIRDLLFYLEGDSVLIKGLSVEGIRFPVDRVASEINGSGNFLRFYGVKNGRTTIGMQIESAKPSVRIRLLALIPGLPKIEPIVAMPDDLMHSRFSDYTILEKIYEL